MWLQGEGDGGEGIREVVGSTSVGPCRPLQGLGLLEEKSEAETSQSVEELRPALFGAGHTVLPAQCSHLASLAGLPASSSVLVCFRYKGLPIL